MAIPVGYGPDNKLDLISQITTDTRCVEMMARDAESRRPLEARKYPGTHDQPMQSSSEGCATNACGTGETRASVKRRNRIASPTLHPTPLPTDDIEVRKIHNAA